VRHTVSNVVARAAQAEIFCAVTVACHARKRAKLRLKFVTSKPK
jgi:hypothetical protein